MHNVNVDALNQTIVNAEQTPARSRSTSASTASGSPPTARPCNTSTGTWKSTPAPQKQLDELKRIADECCPGVYCLRNPIELATHLVT